MFSLVSCLSPPLIDWHLCPVSLPLSHLSLSLSLSPSTPRLYLFNFLLFFFIILHIRTSPFFRPVFSSLLLSLSLLLILIFFTPSLPLLFFPLFAFYLLLIFFPLFLPLHSFPLPVSFSFFLPHYRWLFTFLVDYLPCLPPFSA